MTATTATVQPKQNLWWLTLIKGILAFIVGAVLLFSPAKTQANTWLLLVTALGVYWLITGIFDIVHMFIDHTAWGWKLFIGIISILAGGTILMYPVAAAVTLPQVFVLVLGLWGLMNGIVMLLMAFRGGGWGAGILGVIEIVLGLILIANYGVPGMGLTLIWVAAIWGLVGGVVMIFQAFRERRA